MRILVVSTWCPYPTVNGSTLRGYHLLRALATRHDIDLIAFPAPTAPDAAAVQHLREFCRQVTILPQSPFDVVNASSGGLFDARPRSIVQTDNTAVRSLVAQHLASADLAIGLALSAARYLEPATVPVIFEEAEPTQISGQIAAESTALGKARKRLTWWKHARYLRRLIAGMEAVTAVSDTEAAALVALGVEARKVHVVANGAAGTALDRPRAVASPPRIVYAGAVTYAPNLEAVRWFLEHVMPRLRIARPDLEFWVTGDTGDVPVQDLPNHHLARFTGRLADVAAAVGDAAVAVVPLRVGGGTRLKVLEALALGTPVVSTTKGAEGIAVRDGVDALLADEPEAFVAAVQRVLGDAALAATLSSAGRDLVRRTYTWEAIGAQLLAIVDDVSKGTRP